MQMEMQMNTTNGNTHRMHMQIQYNSKYEIQMTTLMNIPMGICINPKQIQTEKSTINETTDAPSLDENENISKISRDTAMNEKNRILFENDNIKGSISLTGSSIDDLTFKKYTETSL